MATYYVATTGNDTTGDGSSGNPWATPGKAAASAGVDDIIYVKSGTYSLTTSTPGAGGPIVFPVNVACQMIGYDTTVGDLGGPPVIDAGSQTSISIVTMDGADGENQGIVNFKIDGNSNSSVIGIDGNNRYDQSATLCWVRRCTIGFDTMSAMSCLASNCTTGFNTVGGAGLHADTCTTGFANFAAGYFVACIASNCTKGWDDAGGYRANLNRCVAYKCSTHGFGTRNTATLSGGVFVNCIAEECGYGWDFNVLAGSILINCASYNNTSGRTDGNEAVDIGAIVLTGSPFIDAPGGDFQLNNTAGAGAELRGVARGVYGKTDNTDIGAVQHSDPAAGGLSFVNTRRNLLIGR